MNRGMLLFLGVFTFSGASQELPCVSEAAFCGLSTLSHPNQFQTCDWCVCNAMSLLSPKEVDTYCSANPEWMFTCQVEMDSDYGYRCRANLSPDVGLALAAILGISCIFYFCVYKASVNHVQEYDITPDKLILTAYDCSCCKSCSHMKHNVKLAHISSIQVNKDFCISIPPFWILIPCIMAPFFLMPWIFFNCSTFVESVHPYFTTTEYNDRCPFDYVFKTIGVILIIVCSVVTLLYWIIKHKKRFVVIETTSGKSYSIYLGLCCGGRNDVETLMEWFDDPQRATYQSKEANEKGSANAGDALLQVPMSAITGIN